MIPIEEDMLMKTLTAIILALFTLVSLHSVTFAATSEVTWKDYEKYRDIYPGNESRKHFRERTFKNFEKHFAKLAQSLPEGLTLKIVVTNVDLAGDTHIGGIHRLRIIKELYSPQLTFSYQLLGADDAEITSAAVELRDMNFMMGSNLRYRNDSLGYEKQMLDDWFKESFNDRIVDKKK